MGLLYYMAGLSGREIDRDIWPSAELPLTKTDTLSNRNICGAWRYGILYVP